MKDRAKIGNGKSSKIKTPTLPATYAEFKTACESGVQFVDINPNDSLTTDAGVTEIGTPLNTANLLSDATALALGLTNTATPDDAFQEIANAIDVLNTLTFASTDWTASGTGWTQTVNLSGITIDSKPIPSVYFSAPTNEATCKAELKAAACVRRFTTGAGTITATASKLPTTTFYIQFKGV